MRRVNSYTITTDVSLTTTGFVNPPCPITIVEASASHVVGSLPPLDEFTAPVHQEQFVAGQERVQQHTAEQIMHVPVLQIQEQSMESVTVIPQESFLGRIMEQIVCGPVPQGFKELVSATVDEFTDDARQLIRLRRVFDAALAERTAQERSFKKRTRRQSQRQPARLPKRQRRANARSELWTVTERRIQPSF